MENAMQPSRLETKSSREIQRELFSMLFQAVIEMAPPDTQRALNAKMDEMNYAQEREMRERYDL